MSLNALRELSKNIDVSNMIIAAIFQHNSKLKTKKVEQIFFNLNFPILTKS